MKLNKVTSVILITVTMGIAAVTVPLLADGKKSCEHKRHGSAHSPMMNHHGAMGKNPDKLIDVMAYKLDLSDEQRDLAFEKIDEYRPQLRQTRNAIHDGMSQLYEIDSGAENFQSNLTELANQQGKLIADMIKLNAAIYVEFEELLSDEQKTKLIEMRRNHDHRRGFGHNRQSKS